MADLVFYTGAMGSGKTAQALILKYQYEKNGKKVWLIKPLSPKELLQNSQKPSCTETRSRIGLGALATAISPDDSLVLPIGIDVIICDEAQSLTAKQVEELKVISEKQDIPVFCYGLRTNSDSSLFEGAKRLFELASIIKEVSLQCRCGNTAIINYKDTQGVFVTFEALCYNCWQNQRKEQK